MRRSRIPALFVAALTGLAPAHAETRPGTPTSPTRTDTSAPKFPTYERHGAQLRPLLIHHTRLSADQVRAALGGGSGIEVRPYSIKQGDARADVLRVGGLSTAAMVVRLRQADPTCVLGFLDGAPIPPPAMDDAARKRWDDLLKSLAHVALVRGLGPYGGTGAIGPGAPGPEGPAYPGSDDGGYWRYVCADCPPEPVWGKDCRALDQDKDAALQALLEVEAELAVLYATLQSIQDLGFNIQMGKLVLSVASAAVTMATAGTGTAFSVAAAELILDMAAGQALEALLGDVLKPEVIAEGLAAQRVQERIDEVSAGRTQAQAAFDAARQAWMDCMNQPGPHMTTAEIVAATRAQEAHDNCKYQQEFHGIGCDWVYVKP